MDQVSVLEGSAYILPECSFTAPEGKKFYLWILNNSEQTSAYLAPGTSINIWSDTTLKADWESIEVNEVTVSGGVYRLNADKQTASFAGATNKNAKKITIKDTVSANGKKYKVTEIKASACKNMGKLTTVTIGANIKTIGKSAFQGCAKLKTVTIKTKKLTSSSVKSNAFKGIYKKVTFNCPSGKKNAYKKILLKKGAPKTSKFK